MLTVQHRQEALSRAYIQAVAAKCGMSCSFYDFDYGIDMTLNEVSLRNNRYVVSGFRLDVQAKSTTNAQIKNGVITYKLDIKNYDDLRMTEVGCPRILVLLLLPETEDHWLRLNHMKLTMRKSAYWLLLRGRKRSANKSKISIRIPTSNLFSASRLSLMMQNIRRGCSP